MNEMTQAKATAQTARGWRNGEVVGASCMDRISSGGGRGGLDVGRQVGEGGERGEQRALVLGVEHREPLGDAPGAIGAVLRRGARGRHSVSSTRMARPSAGSAARSAQPCSSSRLTSAVIAGCVMPSRRGEVGDPLRPGRVEAVHQAQRRGGHVLRLPGAAQPGDDLLEGPAEGELLRR